MLALNRMEIEEAGPNPECLASAIHAQLRLTAGRVPVYDIAEALDIVEIREKPLMGLEGALVTTPDRNVGSVAVNSKSRPERRRFTLAHELGHFLNLWHEPKDTTGRFSCSRSDLGIGWGSQSVKRTRHVDQEIQANRFAIELLAPAPFLRRYLYGVPDLEKALKTSEALAISREAAARRYAELHARPVALVFSTEGVVRYVQRRPDFPFVSLQRGDRMTDIPGSIAEDRISSHVEADPRDWLARPREGALLAQTLRQKDGYAITLLLLDESEDDQRDD